VEALKANSDLSSEQRQAALAQIRTETEASVKNRARRQTFQTLPKQWRLVDQQPRAFNFAKSE